MNQSKTQNDVSAKDASLTAAPGHTRALQMLDLILEADSLCLPSWVYLNDRKVQSVGFEFNTTNCEFTIGKSRMNYQIPDAHIAADDGPEVVDHIRQLFQKVREMDSAEAARTKSDRNAKAEALAKLSPADKKALGLA